MKTRFNMLAASAIALIAAVPAAASLTTLEDGNLNGWTNSGRDTISSINGNPGACVDEPVLDVFGLDVRNDSLSEILGDYTAHTGKVKFSIDIQTLSINPWWDPTFQYTRTLVLELRQYTPSAPTPYMSVWTELGLLTNANTGYVTFSTEITDTNSTTLPTGWFGAGDEDPNTFEPILPAGVTFADVLSKVDEVHFTTFVPGYFYGFTDFYVRLDNIETSFVVVPEPSSLGFAALALPALARRRRA